MPSKENLEKGWLTTGQTAERLGRSRQGVRDLARNGDLKAILVGKGHPGQGAWIYDLQSVEDFIGRHGVKKGGERS